MRGYMRNTLGFDFLGRIEDMNRQNMAMFEQAMKMFNPFMAAMPGMGQGAAPDAASSTPPAPRDATTPPVAPVAPPPGNARDNGESQAIDELRRKLEELQAQLTTISRREG